MMWPAAAGAMAVWYGRHAVYAGALHAGPDAVVLENAVLPVVAVVPVPATVEGGAAVVRVAAVLLTVLLLLASTVVMGPTGVAVVLASGAAVAALVV